MPHSLVLRVGSLDQLSLLLCALCVSALILSFLPLPSFIYHQKLSGHFRAA